MPLNLRWRSKPLRDVALEFLDGVRSQLAVRVLLRGVLDQVVGTTKRAVLVLEQFRYDVQRPEAGRMVRFTE